MFGIRNMIAAHEFRRKALPPAPAGTALATQAAALSAGQWAQVTGVSGLSLFTGQQGSSGLSIAYASKVGRDPNNKKLYFLGCDHGDETLFLVFDEATNAWTEQAASVPWGIEASGTTSHGYDHTVYDNVHDKLYHRPYGTLALRRWDGGTTWGTISYSGSLFYASASAGVAWFPTMGANGRIVIYQLENGINGGLISIDPVTQGITIHNNGGNSVLANTGDPHCFCIYSPQYDCVVFGGGNGSNNVWKMNASGTITQLDDIPAAITATAGPAGDPCALVFCQPSDGRIRVMQSASVSRLLDPNAGTGSQWSDPGGTSSVLSANTVGTGAYGVACAPIPEYGVVAFIKNWSAAQPAQLWIAKL